MKYALLLLYWTSFYSVGTGLPEATKVIKPKEELNTQVRLETASTFKDLYQANDNPKFTIFWNRTFDDQLSEWRSASPLEVGTNSLTVDDQKSSLNITSESSSRKLIQHSDIARPAPDENQFEEFKSAFINPFLKASTQFVDRNIIMRQEAEAYSESDSSTLVDAKQIETKALQAKTDFIIQLLFIPTPQNELQFNVTLEIKHIKSGRLVAKVSSNKHELPTTWEASQNGFIKIKKADNSLTFHTLGIEMAESTMTALIEFWRER